MPTCIYYITDEVDHNKSGEAISARAMQSLNEGSIVQRFETIKGTLYGSTTKTPAPTKTPDKIILLAHTDSGNPAKIGDKDPEELADNFAQMFKNNEKAIIQHIYLISCEAGMGSPSLAAQFARAMYNKGFNNIHIHAVAHPIGIEFGGGVEVTTRRGQWTGGTEGQVTGYYYANAESKEIHQIRCLMNNRNKTNEEEQSLNELQKKHPKSNLPQAKMITLVTGIEEMDELHNTFTARGPQAKISADMAVALSFLKETRIGLIKHSETNITNALNKMLEELKDNTEDTHAKIITKLNNIAQSWNTQNRSNIPSMFRRSNAVNPLEKYITELNARLNEINGTNIENNTTHEEEEPLLNTQSNKQQLIDQLNNYATKREQEFGFHWDILYLKSLSFWIIDFVSSIAKNIGLIEEKTDYLNIKYRDTKVNAANKLLAILNGQNPELTEIERHSLQEGSLSSIVSSSSYRSLDSIISANKVTPSLAAEDQSHISNKKKNKWY